MTISSTRRIGGLTSRGQTKAITSVEMTVAGRQVLRLRYGLDDGVSRTLGNVGLTCGHSRERVRQIEGAAMRRLMILARAHGDGASLSATQRSDVITFHPAWLASWKSHQGSAPDD